MSFKRLKQQIENHISWFTFTGKMKFSDIINKLKKEKQSENSGHCFCRK